MFHVIVNANSIEKHVIQIKNGIIKHVNVNVRIIVSAKKNIVGGILVYICENSKYLKSIADTSVMECYEIITVMDILLTKMANAIATNVTSAASIDSQTKKLRDCYILDTVLLVIISLLVIIIICYYYAKKVY